MILNPSAMIERQLQARELIASRLWTEYLKPRLQGMVADLEVTILATADCARERTERDLLLRIIKLPSGDLAPVGEQTTNEE